MNIKKALAIIGTLSLICCNICSCSENKTSNKSSDNITSSNSEAETKASETTAATSAIETTKEEPTEPETEPGNKISEEEQAKINEACIARLTEFTQMECYNPYDYPCGYTLCDINEDGIDELIVHYMSFLGETEALYYYDDGEYYEIASATESGIDICIDGHFIQFSTWDGRESRNIIELDGEDFKRDVISSLPEIYQHNDVEISEDEFNKLNEKYDSYDWEKPAFEDFSTILPESVVFPEIDLSGIGGSYGNNNGGGISLDSIVGTWKLSHFMDENNQPIYFDDMDYGYVFYADGTGYLYNGSKTWNFTYTSTGVNSYEVRFSNDSNPAYCRMENGYFVSWEEYYYKRCY